MTGQLHTLVTITPWNEALVPTG